VSGETTVEVNGKKLTLPAGSLVSHALAAAGGRHLPGTILGIVSGREEARKEVATEFRIVTSRGEIRIELTGNLKDIWLGCYGRFAGAELKWATGQAVSFGPAPSGVKPGKGAVDMKRWNVSFGTGGYDARSTFLILSKANHTSDYGVRDGVFANIVSGRNVLASLGAGDSIVSIEPVIMLEKFASKVVTTDVSLPLEDGMEIHSELVVELLPKAKDGAEHFYAAVKDGTFPVDFAASTFVSSDVMIGELCPYENLAARSEGSVSVRTDGSGRGRIYISKGDMTSNIYHSIVGRVTSGLEVARLASPGQLVAVRTVPERLSVLGMGLAEAEQFLGSRGILYEKAGYQGDSAVVVEQAPGTTMEVVSSGKVRITSIPRDSLVEVRLYDGPARQTTEYFRRATGLKENSVGSLTVFFKYEDTLLFKGKAVHVGELIPENKPEEGAVIPAGEIGMTNTAAKNAGLLGIRFSPSPKFGPTGEKFVATNIVGRVLDLEKLRKAREKDKIYFTEAR
jgi:putative methanogenesis marker protein 3